MALARFPGLASIYPTTLIDLNGAPVTPDPPVDRRVLISK
jgi:hypothetical protein